MAAMSAIPSREDRQRDERARILQAAYALIGQPRATPVSVQDILDEADLSTRAFYRHFRSKDELILAMYRTAAEGAAAELFAAVAAAPDPVEALRTWIERSLAVAYEPRRAKQAAVLTSAEARAAAGFDQAEHASEAIRRARLTEIIRAGREEGVFPDVTDPELDARAVAGVLRNLLQGRLAGDPGPTEPEAVEHTVQLFQRAFGVPGARRGDANPA